MQWTFYKKIWLRWNTMMPQKNLNIELTCDIHFTEL